MTTQLLILLGISLLINVAMFIVAYKQQTDKLTDISYAVSFIALAIYGLATQGSSDLKLILVAMVTLWGLRLGSYLLIRIRKIGRDKRFDGIRNDFLKFGKFWIGQGLAVWIILLPVLLVELNDEPLIEMASLFGIIVWGAGLIIETVADQQKFAFINKPANKGKWIDSGIWRYSRHPNYLGEILVWLGVYITALPALTAAQAGIGILSPLFIMALLLFVSGIPPLEKQADERWGDNPKYHDYKARTSLLLLWPPKK